MKVTFLGTGTSVGVPVIGCGCPVCTSDDPRNRRLRPSLWIQKDGFSLLVDSSTDLRQQALTHGIHRLDAVLYTHAHADHILGLDELRIYNYRQRTTLPVYGSPPTLENLRRTFWYAFDEDVPQGGGVPRLELHEVEEPFSTGPFRVVPIPLWHGTTPVLGFRIGGFAYCTDCNKIPASSRDLLRNLDVLVLDALRDAPHPTHYTVEEALEVLEDLAPRRAFLTHMTHDLEYAELDARTPPHVHPARDGLVLEL